MGTGASGWGWQSQVPRDPLEHCHFSCSTLGTALSWSGSDARCVWRRLSSRAGSSISPGVGEDSCPTAPSVGCGKSQAHQAGMWRGTWSAAGLANTDSEHLRWADGSAGWLWISLWDPNKDTLSGLPSLPLRLSSPGRPWAPTTFLPDTLTLRPHHGPNFCERTQFLTVGRQLCIILGRPSRTEMERELLITFQAVRHDYRKADWIVFIKLWLHVCFVRPFFLVGSRWNRMTDIFCCGPATTPPVPGGVPVCPGLTGELQSPASHT